MNITITDPKATENHQIFAQLFLKQWAKYNNRTLFIYMGIGLLLISYDLLNFNDCTLELNTGFLKGKLTSNKLECINLHLSLGAGIGFCYLCLAQLYGVSRDKEKTSLQTWKRNKNLYGRSNTQTTIIDDTGIQVVGESFCFQYQWGLPKYFVRYDNFIAVYTEDCGTLCCIINVNLISDDSKNDLLSLFEKNLKEENIKQFNKHLKQFAASCNHLIGR